jgi:hypothetical protein
MTPERQKKPDWAHQERQTDFAWISWNLDVFWAAGTAAFEDVGQGAIAGDTTSLPVPGAGHPFGYLPREQIGKYGDEDTKRMAVEYNPAQELVLVLLKSNERSSTYRVGASQGQSLGIPPSPATASPAIESGARPKLKPPEIETLIAREAEGGCEAACTDHYWVEPDGVCPHGHPSWLRKLGLI